MKRTLMTLAGLAFLLLVNTPDLLAQRGGRGGGGYRGGFSGGGQPRMGTGYGGTARTGEGDGMRTGYGGGFGTGYGNGRGGEEQPRLGTGYGGTARTGEGDGFRTGYGNGRGGEEQPRLGTGYGGTVRTGEGDGFRTGYGAAAGGAWGRYGVPGVGVGYAGLGTYHQPSAAMYAQAGAVRNGFGYYGAFAPNWYARYPNAWYARGWAAGAAWNYATWPALAAFTTFPDTLAYYDYGTSVVYQGNDVYINGDNVGTQEAYAQQATAIATAGRNAKVTQDGDWMPLGVFGMLTSDQQQNATDIFQLAINKDGIIRGTYYNATNDSTQTVYGCVGTKSERAAWTVGDQKTPVYEAGIANLTKPETTMLVHFGKGNTQQYTLVRMDKPKQGQ